MLSSGHKLLAIPQRHSRKAPVFNIDIYGYNHCRLPPKDKTHGAIYSSTLQELLKISDVISVCCPLPASTKSLFSHKEPSRIKVGVFLINTARGEIIDDDALVAALENGEVARAGSDVFEEEPKIHPDYAKSDRYVSQTTPWRTHKAVKRNDKRECLVNMNTLFNTGNPVAPVNEIASKQEYRYFPCCDFQRSRTDHLSWTKGNPPLYFHLPSNLHQSAYFLISAN